MTDLRTRIAAVIDREVDGFWEPLDVADAVIRELDLAIPCTATGCRMRQIAKRHAESSSRLEMLDE